MKITIVSFVVCLVLAIPTYGLSLLMYFVAKFFIDQAGQEKLAASVILSQNTNNPAQVVSYVNNAAIRGFFNKYGTTEVKYKHTDGVYKGLYSGYVNVDGNGEVVLTIIKNGASLIIKCYELPTDFGSDILSLMRKAGFHDEIIDVILKESKKAAPEGTA